MYPLLDYDDFTDSTADSACSPYAQLLSMTNPAEAHANFVATRLNGQDTTSFQHYSTGLGNTSFFQRYRIRIIAAAVATGVLALTGAVWFVALRRKPVYRTLYDLPSWETCLIRGQAGDDVGLGISLTHWRGSIVVCITLLAKHGDSRGLICYRLIVLLSCFLLA